MLSQEYRKVETENQPAPRRHFGASVVGDKWFVVYGGIGSNGKFMNDINFLNLGSLFFYLIYF
jgi:hypothetical protein